MARLAAVTGLSGLCVYFGTALFLLMGGPGGRAALALAPYPLALLLRVAARRDLVPSLSPRREIVFAAVLVLIGGAFASWSLVLPPYQYDSFLYHLPSAALAWSEKSLFLHAAHPQVGSNPMTAELPKVWAFAFSGDDSLASAQQVPYLVGLAAITFSLAARLRAPFALRCLAALTLLAVPKLAELAPTPNVDVISAFWGTASALLVFAGSPVVAGTALVLFAQMKYTTLLPAAAGALILAHRRLRPHGLTLTLGWLALFTALGGLWEWRNLLSYGNPTRPYQAMVSAPLAAAGKKLAPGFFVAPGEADPAKWSGYFLNRVEEAGGRSGLFHHLYAWADRESVPYDLPGGRWGPAWIALAVPGLLLMLALARRHRPRWLPFALAFVFLALMPKSWETRFAFHLLPFGFAAGAWLLALAGRLAGPRWLPIAAGAVLLLWSSWQVTQVHPARAFAASRGAALSIPASSAGAGLVFTSTDPARFRVAELALATDTLAPAELWIDFTHGERHAYGMSETLLYPYFSRDWSRRVKIFSASPSDVPGSPAAYLLQAGSLLEGKLEARGYRKIMANEAGSLYAR